jgi:pilus assembly protein CpaC
MNEIKQKMTVRPTALTVAYGRRMMFLLFLCAGLAAPGLRGEELTVFKGSSTKIAVPEGIRKIVIGSESIIDAKPQEDGRAALVVGLNEGSSELRIERLQGADLVYKVTVRPDLQGTMDQIKELLSDVVGLEIKIVGNKIVFEGKIKTQADWERIKKVESAYGGAIIDLATFDQPEMAAAVQTVILKDLHDAGLNTVTVQVTGDTVVLDGTVYSDADLARAVEKAKLRMPNVKSLLRVQQVMIETDLNFVSLSRNNGSSFGQNLFDNAISLSPNFQAGNSGRPSLSMGASATYSINAALTAGNSKSIYQQHMSGASGQEVSFKQGGTIYVPVAGNVGGSLLPIPYGVIIKVKPTLQGKDGILTDVNVEVSTAAASGGSVTTTEFKTSASALSKIGETVVLSGFAQALSTGSSDKTPILGDIPLLNLMFAQKTKSKTKSEAVLLTPRPSFSEAATGPAYSEGTKAILNAPDPVK